ncbi:SEA domain-containing protein [Aphelenchoides bicaudatus]|nr:SEA domain-containing protein [Aphelenchoides bicaudatus]
MTKEEAKQEDEKMNKAPKEEGEDGMEKTMTETPKSSMEMDKATEMMPKEEGDLIPKEDATEAPNTDSSTPIDSHSTSAAKEETAPSSPMEKENSQPAFVPMPSETVQQSTSHSVGSNEATEVTKPVLLETTTALPTEAIVESEPKILATNAPIEMIEDDKDDMEKVSKSPAERPQFEEPKMETTEKPDSVGIVEKSEPEMKESEESQTDAPANIPTAETHLMTSESAEVHQQSSTTMASEQPRETTDATHSTDEEGLFAGDMHNVFAGHHHTELTTQSVDTMTTQKVEQEPKFAEEITETEPQPEPTAEPKPEPEPKSNDDEPSAIPEPTAEPQPEPTAEPQPEPTAEPEPTQHVHHSHVVHAPENIVTDTMKTPFSLRFTNIDYTDEFKNLNSGAARKLHDQIYDDLSRAFEETLGDNYVGFELLNFRSGSLIVDGRLLSRDELGDPSMVAAKLEDTLQKAGGRLGGNTLDLKSVYVDGIVSKGGAELDQDGSTTAAANTGYIVGGSIAIGVLIMAFIVFAVIVFGVNARRQKSRTLKLKEELSMAEHGRSTFAGGLNGRNNGQGPVNLMSYGNTTPGQSSANGHSTTTTAAANNSPMLLNSTQFSSPQGFQSN